MRASKTPGSQSDTPRTPSSSRDHDAYECARVWTVLHAAHTRLSEYLSVALDECCDLTISDFEVLTHLKLVEPRRLRLSDLNHAVALSQPAISRLVARLERRGLVERDDEPDDARVVLVGLTDRGHEIAQQAMEVHISCIHEVLAGGLSREELDALIASLSRIHPMAE